MNKKYAVVESNGAINSTYSSPYLFIPCGDEVDDSTHYYDYKDGILKEKQKISTEFVVDGLSVSVSGAPEGMVVETNGSSGTTDGEVLNVHFDVPGTYTITFSGSVDHLDYSLEVTVGDT